MKVPLSVRRRAVTSMPPGDMLNPIQTKAPRLARGAGAKSRAKKARREAMAAHAPVSVTLPIRTVNPLNNRTHWRVVARRSKTERLYSKYALLAQNLPPLPVVVTLTRLSRGEMDTDGLAASFKAVRDGIADAYGCGDGSRSGLTFRYGQERAKAFGVRIVVAPAAPEAAQ